MICALQSYMYDVNSAIIARLIESLALVIFGSVKVHSHKFTGFVYFMVENASK